MLLTRIAGDDHVLCPLCDRPMTAHITSKNGLVYCPCNGNALTTVKLQRLARVAVPGYLRIVRKELEAHVMACYSRTQILRALDDNP